jgi:hypothetical protein
MFALIPGESNKAPIETASRSRRSPSLGQWNFAQSFVRAYKIAMTPPMGPVAIALDGGLQQAPIHENGERLSTARGTLQHRGRGGRNVIANNPRSIAGGADWLWRDAHYRPGHLGPS